ncbi:MAG: GyrI-like domain-containing protein [Pseudomonadota bacterium]
MSELSYRAQLLAESSSVRKRFEASSELLNQRVDIVRKPEMRIAYVRSIGPYFDVEGANLRASTTLADWAKRRGLWSPDATFLGVCPNAAALTPPNLCVYDVGIVVREDIVEDDTISIQTLPSGKYAALSVACSSLQLDSVWSWMVSTWLPASGETYELKNSYEVYVPGQHDIIKPEYGVEVCLRLV